MPGDVAADIKPPRGVVGREALLVGGGGGRGSFIIISFSWADGSSYGFREYALYVLVKFSCPSLLIASLSGDSDASLPFESELLCEDLCTESADVLEYADSRLDMDELRVSFDVSTASWLTGCAGEGACATAFLGMGGIFFCKIGSDGLTGSAGNGELIGFGANRAPTLSFLGGNAAKAAMMGNGDEPVEDWLLMGDMVFWKVSCEGGGMGSAFEKRERPPVLGVWSRVVSIVGTVRSRELCVMTNRQGLEGCEDEAKK